MKEIKGDLLFLAKNKVFDIIGHGCNCFNTMGAGIAKQIKDIFPGAAIRDRLTIKGDKNKLGTYSVHIENKDLIILNLYTQYDFRGHNNADYNAIRSCMKLLKKDFSGKRIGLPQIGAGLAGGDWNIISKIIEDELKGEDVTIVIYEPSPSITFTEDDLTTTDITKAISSMQTPNVQSKLNLDDLI